MTPEMEQFLSSMRENLNLPDAQAELIVAELRVHLQSDFLDRLRRSGRPEVEAAREAMLEFGDAMGLARELNAEHALHSRRMAMVRNIGAVMLALVGFFAVLFACDPWGLMHVVERLFPRNPNGVMIVGWLAPLWRGLWWMTQHLDVAVQDTILQVLPLVVVGLLVGHIARARGWVLALVPWFLFWALTWQAVARGKFPFGSMTHLAQPAIQAIALVSGAYLGRRLANWHSRTQKVLTGMSVLVATILYLVGFSRTNEGLAVATAFMAGYACVVGLATWGVLILLRRCGQGRQASAAQ